MDLIQEQYALEAEMHGAGVLRFHKSNSRASDSGAGSDADWYRRLMREFVKPMSEAVTAYIDYYKGRRGKLSSTISHLHCLSPEAASYISIKTIFDALCLKDVSIQNLAQKIGQRIEDEVRFTRIDEASPKYVETIKESLKRRNSGSYEFEADVMVHTEKELHELGEFKKMLDAKMSKVDICTTLHIDALRYEALKAKSKFAIDIERWQPWPKADVLQLGAKMIEIFSNNMLLDGKPLVAKENYSTGIANKVQKTARLVPTESLDAWIEGYKEAMAGLSPAFGPCVIQPRDWTTPFNGGYHTEQASSRLHLVKVRSRKHLRKLTLSQMPEVYKAVNKLQSVKWSVNKPLLEIANTIRHRGLPLGMPQLAKYTPPSCPVPAIYTHLRGEDLKAVLDDDQKEAFSLWKREASQVYEKENKRKADIREVNSTLDQAIKYANYMNIYFVYTLDFRGRVYCQSSLISPQGDDMQKALVRFSEPMALGDKGRFWFCVHGANEWGKDKVSFEERVAFVSTEDFQDMCLDIAADPITFTQWTQADKPWQFLSWCLEYAELLEHERAGNPADTFLSRVAVAMDGSCSGIQHYSAMLRDSVGGAEVNLLSSDAPRDIYGAVSKIVAEWMQAIVDGYEQDVPNYDDLSEKYGDVKCYKFAEEWLRLGVTRSMTKKPVMTLPYGSSLLTCRESMELYIKDLQEKMDKQSRLQGVKSAPVHMFSNKDGELPKFEAESFASSLVWKAIGEVVIAARAAMRYIKAVAAEVSAHNKPLTWQTPTGFIVYQELFVQAEDKRIKTQLLGGTYFRVLEDTDKIDARRMQSSAAPNFVHSMDASHLIKAVNAIDSPSIAVIHDSFGTYACLTEELRDVLKGTMVSMYSEHDVLEEFKSYNEGKLLVELEATVPPKGDMDINKILESDYCFA